MFGERRSGEQSDTRKLVDNEYQSLWAKRLRVTPHPSARHILSFLQSGQKPPLFLVHDVSRFIYTSITAVKNSYILRIRYGGTTTVRIIDALTLHQPVLGYNAAQVTKFHTRKFHQIPPVALCVSFVVLCSIRIVLGSDVA